MIRRESQQEKEERRIAASICVDCWGGYYHSRCKGSPCQCSCQWAGGPNYLARIANQARKGDS